ncbi:MAG TPA: hypothetical protein VGB50_09240 [Flavobacterium sp.]|jgi:hypothetical protein
MKKFLIKLSVFGAVAAAIIIFILMRFGGYVDYFYQKFTSPPQKSLILGDSRSFQGIQPSVIKNEMAGNFGMPILNFSFTLAQTAYGDELFNSVRQKLDPETKNGLFIINVHPWLFAQRDEDDFSNDKFFEAAVPPNNMHFLSLNPNVEYFFRNYSYFHFKAIIRRNSIVHDDGWLEEFYLPNDKKILAEWKKTQITLYKGFIKKWKKTDYRLKRFNEMVKFLDKHGTVVLVRMPVDKEITEVENVFWKDFDADMARVAEENKSVYLNFSTVQENYHKYDGVHLEKEAGAAFTKALCDSINKRFN